MQRPAFGWVGQLAQLIRRGLLAPIVDAALVSR